MLRKTIKYQNLDGDELTEDFYFHLTKAELIKLEVSETGGLQKKLQLVVKSQDPKQIIETFEGVIRSSFGVRTEDGRFVKRPEDWEEFVSSEAYSELFMELVTDAAYAAEFIKGIMPTDMASKLVETIDTGTEVKELPQPMLDQEIEAELQEKSQLPAWQREGRDPTQAEIRNMSQEELVEAFRARTSRNG